jgi:glycosyltransferase involved in cell wall biosynthesis
VGGLERDYDPLFLIDSMADIVKQFPQAGLMIVGDGSLREQAELAVRQGEHTNNTCLAGNVDHAVTLHLIQAADIFLRTTLFDGDAISVREALFLGTPVVATNNGMRPDGVNLIKIGDRVGLVRTVANFVKNGRKTKADKAPDTRHSEAVVDLYEELSAD